MDGRTLLVAASETLAIYVSSYCYKRVLILLYMCPQVVYVDGRTVLVAASETRGALVFDFDFELVVGLKGVSVIASSPTSARYTEVCGRMRTYADV